MAPGLCKILPGRAQSLLRVSQLQLDLAEEQRVKGGTRGPVARVVLHVLGSTKQEHPCLLCMQKHMIVSELLQVAFSKVRENICNSLQFTAS